VATWQGNCYATEAADEQTNKRSNEETDRQTDGQEHRVHLNDDKN